MTILHIHRLRPLLEGTKLAAAKDEFFTVLTRAAGDSALGGDAGLGDRMTSAVAAGFTTTQPVVDRIHGLGSRVRAEAHVARAASLAAAGIDPIEIAHP